MRLLSRNRNWKDKGMKWIWASITEHWSVDISPGRVILRTPNAVLVLCQPFPLGKQRCLGANWGSLWAAMY